LDLSEPTSKNPSPVRLVPLTGIPAVEPGDDLAALVIAAAERAGVALRRGVLVVCQKVVSKAEGRMVRLADVEPSEQAKQIAAEDEKDPRHVEVVLGETVRIVRRGHRVMICETRHGFVCANAGVDLSNTPGPEIAVLLPEDADASASRLHDDLTSRGAEEIGVIVSDTFGRPWREGLVDVAIGCAGMSPVIDIRGSTDWSGRELQVTINAAVDQLAAAAGMLMIKDAGVPAVFIEGHAPSGDGKVRDMLRNPAEDLFR
jgi:coenzyme F420-0:L-glutamate ligase/coenzyme F420-1:gamma-L-glutamate ligase